MAEAETLYIHRRSLEQICREAGLDGIGVLAADQPKHYDFYLNWLHNDHHADMDYLQRHAPLKQHPKQLLEGARSVLCFTWSYNKHIAKPDNRQAKVARYALGDDYHQRFKKQLRQFWRLFLNEFVTKKAQTNVKHRVCVDSAPIMERDFAAAAKLGWIGKNGCLIHPKLGSYLFLGEIITNIKLTTEEPTTAIPNCGTCTACIDACPTDAIVADRTIDSKKCIAYLTIEKRGAFNSQQRKQIGKHIFGCDICQEVCPWNKTAPEGSYFENGINSQLISGNSKDLQVASADDFKKHYKNSPINRCGFDGWQRNLKTVENN